MIIKAERVDSLISFKAKFDTSKALNQPRVRKLSKRAT